jgi:hypothetical protein
MPYGTEPKNQHGEGYIISNGLDKAALASIAHVLDEVQLNASATATGDKRCSLILSIMRTTVEYQRKLVQGIIDANFAGPETHDPLK